MSKNDDALLHAAQLHEKHNGEGLLAYCEADIRRLVEENEALASGNADLVSKVECLEGTCDSLEDRVDAQAALLQQALAAMKPVKLVSGDPNPLAEAIAAIEQWQKGKA